MSNPLGHRLIGTFPGELSNDSRISNSTYSRFSAKDEDATTCYLTSDEPYLCSKNRMTSLLSNATKTLDPQSLRSLSTLAESFLIT
jgi:hypothetical protein